MGFSATQTRRRSVGVIVGSVQIGGGAPVVVQSMTNTDTADVAATARRSPSWRAPARSSCASPSTATEAAAAVPHIRDRLDRMGVDVPLVGDFHYNGHMLLAEHPGLRRGAGQVPHQSRQCRLQGEAGPQFRDDDRDGARSSTSPSASASTGARSTRRC